MYKKFYPLNEWVAIKKRKYKKDLLLPQDGFSIRVLSNGECSIRYRDERAKRYANLALTEQKREEKYPVMYLSDYPSFALRGVVEGFYGKPYSHEQRMAIMPFLQKLKMNAYIYAPKDDLYHRDRWREEYPKEEMKNLLNLVECAKKHQIDFFFAISPGKDFDFAKEEDYAILLHKLKKVQSIGIKRFVLLMDDIEAKLTEKQAELFSSAAQAQAHVANFLLENLMPQAPFLFCPTDYMQNFDTPYRAELRKYLDKNVEVFWTGYNTIAEAITEEDGEEVMANFARRPILWDNYPVNDFDPKRRVYLGAVTGRGRRLNETHIGYIANLSELYECSKIPLATMASYAWDCENYDAKKAQDSAVRAYFKGCVRAGKIFSEENEANIMLAPIKRKAWFEQEQFAKADAHYRRIKGALEVLKTKAPVGFLQETEELRSFMETECELYFLFRQGKAEPLLQEYVKKLNASKYAPYDLSFLEYLNKKYSLEEPFAIDAERIIYRSWEK